MSGFELGDRMVEFLNHRGYQPITMPRGGVMPPTLYKSRGAGYQLTGDLAARLSGHPEAIASLKSTPQPVMNLSKDLDAEAGGELSLTLFQKLMARLGLAGSVGAKANLNIGNDVQFKFEDVTSRFVAPDTILAAVAKLPSTAFGDLQADPVYIAYEYLYARRASMAVGKSHDGSAEVSFDGGDLGSAKAGGHSKSTAGEKGNFDGGGNAQAVAFAFAIGRLTYRDGGYAFDWKTKAGANLAPAAGRPGRKVYLPNRIVEIVE